MKKIIILLSTVFLLSCSQETLVSPTQDSQATSDVSLFFNKTEAVKDLVVSAEAIVTAPDIDTLSFTLNVSEESVEGTLTEIPAGEKRKIEIFCYDANQKLTYEGSSFVDVVAGKTTLVEMILYPVTSTGDVIVVGSFSPYPRQEGIIVFVSDYNGSFDVYRVDTNGDNLIQLTHSERNDYYPRISPDKNKIIFTRKVDEIRRPFIVDIDGSNLRELEFVPEKSIGYCDWSPDGSKLVFHATDKYDYYNTNLYIYEFSNGEITEIVKNTSTNWLPKWSPDGSKIIFYSNISGLFRIYTVDTDGSDLELLTNTSGFEEKVPAYSPDGNEIVFAGRYEGDWGIYLVDFYGNNLLEIVNEDIDEHIPSFSPDGQKIIFQRRTYDKGNGIYVMDKSGKNIKMILDTEYNEESAHWR